MTYYKERRERDSDNFIHATVVTSQKIIEQLGKDLPKLFFKYKVSLVSIAPAFNFGHDAVTLILAGKETDIRKSLNNLKMICSEKETGVEKSPIRSIPPSMKSYLNDMEDAFKFEKIFSYCSKEYLDFCKAHNIKPHPEVEETIKPQ